VEANSATAQLQLSRWERAAKLSHPHLIRLLQGGRCQLGRATMLYVVTELAEQNVGQILAQRPLTQAETEYMLRSLLEVLAYLHGQGLVHSRLKPGNIMAVDETMRVSSDGICGVGDRNLGHGPPTVYDPPEVAAAGFSRAGDVWSLGITLVEALTQRPSAGEGIRQGDPALPDTAPAAFLEIARQCLRLDPQRRWSVPDIAARLLPSMPAPRKRPALSRYTFWVVAGAGLILVLLAAARFLDRRPPDGTSTPPGVVKPSEAPPMAGPAQQPSASPTPSVHSQVTADKPADKPTAPATTPAARAASAASVPPPPPARKVKGDSAPGVVAEQVLPPVSQRSRDTITGKVRVGVRVSVNSSGKVTEATLAAPGPSRYFAHLALRASKRWKFAPPQVNGEPVSSEWVLRFEFGRKTTEVRPRQISPTT
jgi:TonB family protein